MMNGDEGGQLSDFIGGDTVLMRGDIRLIGGIPPVPPTRENPVYKYHFMPSGNYSIDFQVYHTDLSFFIHEVLVSRICGGECADGTNHACSLS